MKIIIIALFFIILGCQSKNNDTECECPQMVGMAMPQYDVYEELTNFNSCGELLEKTYPKYPTVSCSCLKAPLNTALPIQPIKLRTPSIQEKNQYVYLANEKSLQIMDTMTQAIIKTIDFNHPIIDLIIDGENFLVVTQIGNYYMLSKTELIFFTLNDSLPTNEPKKTLTLDGLYKEYTISNDAISLIFEYRIQSSQPVPSINDLENDSNIFTCEDILAASDMTSPDLFYLVHLNLDDGRVVGKQGLHGSFYDYFTESNNVIIYTTLYYSRKSSFSKFKKNESYPEKTILLDGMLTNGKNIIKKESHFQIMTYLDGSMQLNFLTKDFETFHPPYTLEGVSRSVDNSLFSKGDYLFISFLGSENLITQLNLANLSDISIENQVTYPEKTLELLPFSDETFIRISDIGSNDEIEMSLHAFDQTDWSTPHPKYKFNIGSFYYPFYSGNFNYKIHQDFLAIKINNSFHLFRISETDGIIFLMKKDIEKSSKYHFKGDHLYLISGGTLTIFNLNLEIPSTIPL